MSEDAIILLTVGWATIIVAMVLVFSQLRVDLARMEARLTAKLAGLAARTGDRPEQPGERDAA